MKIWESFRKTLKSKGARPFLFAGFLSSLGDWIYFVGMSAFMYNQFGPLAIGILAVIRQAAGMLFAPVAGYLADKYPRRNLIMISNLFSAALMIILIVLTSYDKHYLSLYLVVGILLVLSGSLDRIAKLSLVPQLVNKEDRLALNSLLNTIGTFSLMVAPIIGGSLLGSQLLMWNFLFNSISFIISFLLISMVPKPVGIIENNPETSGNKTKDSIGRTYKVWIQGIKYIFQVRTIRSVTILMLLNHVIVGTTWVFIPALAELLGQKDVGIGYLLTTIGIGSIVGALIGAYIGSKSLYKAIGIGVIFLPIILILCGLHEYIILSYGFMILLGMFANISDGSMWTMLQKETPSNVSGRVYATVDVITVAGMSLGSFITGILLSNFSLTLSLFIFGALILLLSTFSLYELVKGRKNENLEKKEVV